MAAQYKIIIKNMSDRQVDFFTFQEQAAFTNSGASPAIYSSCLACRSLSPNATSGAQLDFGFDAQNYVGALSRIPMQSLAMLNVCISLANVKNTTSVTSATQPIELTPSPAGQAVDNATIMTASPLGLSQPTYQAGLGAGQFAVQIPSYTPAPTPELYCGCAAINQDGSITLSSFIAPSPNTNLYCAPAPVFYVKVGNYEVGEVIPYDTSQSAECDFSNGAQVINVEYLSDGSFTTS